MFRFLQRQWFLIGIACATLLAYIFPSWGSIFNDYDIFDAGIFLAFLTTGLGLETRSILRQVKRVKAPVTALISSLVLYPVIAWLTAISILPHEFVVGICIIAVSPVTVSSGTIMTAIARGNVPLSLLICILTSFFAIFTIPIILSLLLNTGEQINLPVIAMFLGLVVKVLVPLLIGQVIRPFIRPLIKRVDRQMSIFQSVIILLIIFNAVSRSAEDISRAGTTLFSVILFVIFLHVLMLITNYFLSRLISLDRSSTIAFTIHTSQKTLTITYIVWVGYFADQYPMAFIPAIICQLTQMTIGTFVTEYFRKRS